MRSDVVRRFGSAEEMVAVGDSREEEDAARRTGMDFIKITVPEVRSKPSFRVLAHTQYSGCF